MKKILLLCLLVLGCMDMQAQDGRKRNRYVNRDSLPYMKSPDMPVFNIRLMDSVTIFNTFNIPKGQPTVIFFFDPGCKHCQAVTDDLLPQMDSLKHIQFYFITPNADFAAIRKFYADHHMADYPNIKLAGRDYDFFFLDYFEVQNLPTLALYDGQKQFIHLFDGRATMRELADYTRKK